MEFAFSGNKITAILLCVGVIAINLVFVIDQVNDADMNSWYMVLIGETDKRTNRFNTSGSCTDAGSLSIPPFPVIFAICYIFFNIYLVIHVVASFGNESVLNMPVSI